MDKMEHLLQTEQTSHPAELCTGTELLQMWPSKSTTKGLSSK